MSNCRPIDVFPLIASSYGEGGMCPAGANGEFSEEQQQELLTALNQMLPMLIKRMDSKGTLTRWEVPVRAGVFALPPDCLEVRQAFLNGCAVTLRDRWFEGRIGHKVSSCNQWCGGPDLIDVGDGYVIPEQWPAHIQDTRFGVFAENDEDAGKTVQVRYMDRYGHPQEEVLELQSSQQITHTEGAVTNVTFIYKGITSGAVVGMITYTAKKPDRLLRIPANVASPSYHWKKLPATFRNCTGVLSLIGKIRFTPMTSITDPLPICDELALSFGLQALTAMKNRQYDVFNTSLSFAVNELLKSEGDLQSAGTVIQMAVKSPARFHTRYFFP